MRYRPLAHFNLSVSAVSLALTDDQGQRAVEDWVGLIVGALELGVNCFEVQGRHPNIAAALQIALASVERRLVVLGWRIGPRSVPEQFSARAFQPDLIQASIQSALVRSNAGYLDMVLLDDPGEHDLPPKSLTLLKQLKAKGLVRYIGVAGQDEAIDAYILTNAFDILALPFSMASGWRDRLRVRAAHDYQMAVIGYDFFPSALHAAAPPKPPPKRRFWQPKPPPEPHDGAYDFLGQTRDWTGQQICLAYALTEPGLATVQTVADDLERLQGLAATADRDLPAGLGAQIEMARINAGKTDDSQRRA